MAPQPLSFLCWPEWGARSLLGSSPARLHPPIISQATGLQASTLDTPSSLSLPQVWHPQPSPPGHSPLRLRGTGQSFLQSAPFTTTPSALGIGPGIHSDTQHLLITTVLVQTSTPEQALSACSLKCGPPAPTLNYSPSQALFPFSPNLTRGSDDLFGIWRSLLENTTPTQERPRVCFVPILPTSPGVYLGTSSRAGWNGLPRLGRLAVTSMVEAWGGRSGLRDPAAGSGTCLAKSTISSETRR